LSDRDEGDEEHVLHAHADVLGVAGEAADEAADGLAVEVTHRQSEPVSEHGGAQVVDDGLADLERPLDAIAEGELGEEGEGGEGTDAPGELAQVAAGDGSVDDRPDRPCEEGQLDPPQRHGDEEPDHGAPVGSGETQEPPDQGKGKGSLGALVGVAALAAEMGNGLSIDDARDLRAGRGGGVRPVGLVGPVRL